jgi:hypothetical protein
MVSSFGAKAVFAAGWCRGEVGGPRPGYVRGGDEQDQPTAEPAAERVADQAAHSSTATLAVAGWRRSVRAAEAVGVVATRGGRSLCLIGCVRRLNRPSSSSVGGPSLNPVFPGAGCRVACSRLSGAAIGLNRTTCVVDLVLRLGASRQG